MILATFLMTLASWMPDRPPPGPPGAYPPPPAGRVGANLQPGWLDSALTGRTRKPWSGIVELELPGGRTDTASVCGGPDGFRLDFGDGRAHWVHADSFVFLNGRTKSARLSTHERWSHPSFPGSPPLVIGVDSLLGRRTLVLAQRGPRGGARRLWVDTTLPLLLRGEGPGPGARRVLSLDLARGCSPGAFTIPAGWTVDTREPKPPNEETSVAVLSQRVGFRIPMPAWLPAGFEPAGQSWMEGRRKRIAHVRWSDGARLVSLFATGGSKGFRNCDDDGPCQEDGPDPAMVRRFDDVSVLVTAPLSPDEIRRIVESLR